MATIVFRNGRAGRAQYAKLERLLSQQDAILRSHKQILREGLPTATSGVLDAEEHSLDAEERGIGFSLVALTSQEIRGIEAALRRLAAGEFGKCSDCQGGIGDARLRARPVATRCLACQERDDIASSPRRSSRQHQA